MRRDRFFVRKYPKTMRVYQQSWRRGVKRRLVRCNPSTDILMVTSIGEEKHEHGWFKPSPLRGLEIVLRLPGYLVLMVLRGLWVAALMTNNRARRMNLAMKMEMKALRITRKTKKTIVSIQRVKAKDPMMTSPTKNKKWADT